MSLRGESDWKLWCCIVVSLNDLVRYPITAVYSALRPLLPDFLSLRLWLSYGDLCYGTALKGAGTRVSGLGRKTLGGECDVPSRRH